MCSLACRAVSMELLSISVSPLTTSASSPVYSNSECTQCVSQGIACYTLGREKMFLSNRNIYTVNYKHSGKVYEDSDYTPYGMVGYQLHFK